MPRFFDSYCLKKHCIYEAHDRRTTIFIGPSFLYGKSDLETIFFSLFSHLLSLFSDSDGKMVIGTDDETAMRNGIHQAFRNAT